MGLIEEKKRKMSSSRNGSLGRALGVPVDDLLTHCMHSWSGAASFVHHSTLAKPVGDLVDEIG